MYELTLLQTVNFFYLPAASGIASTTSIRSTEYAISQASRRLLKRELTSLSQMDQGRAETLPKHTNTMLRLPEATMTIGAIWTLQVRGGCN